MTQVNHGFSSIDTHSPSDSVAMPLLPDQSNESSDEAWREFRNEMQNTDIMFLDRYYGSGQSSKERREVDKAVSEFMLEMDTSELHGRTVLSNMHPSEDPSRVQRSNNLFQEFIKKENLVRIAYSIHKANFPPEIWYCCRSLCFASVCSDPLQAQLFEELLQIHRYAEGCHKAAEGLDCYVEERQKGKGTTDVAFVSLKNSEDDQSNETCRTSRQKQMLHFARFVVEVLPFLYGKIDSPRGTLAPKRKLCTVAICCLLGVSRNFLYHRKKIPCSDTASEKELRSLVDITGLRLRQHRRKGGRGNYPPLRNLQTYDYGCDVPCFADTNPWILVSEFQEFCTISQSLNPRHKENCYLLNRLFDPLCNSTRRTCNRALSALYAVSETLIADIRRALDQMCKDVRWDEEGQPLLNRDTLHNGSLRYKYHRGHPINRYGPKVREKIENTLDFVLRADPSGGNGKEGQSVYRVYDPEINTQEKLREALRKALDQDADVEVDLSSSSLQRMINDYLENRNHSRISFQQSDHNACPLCKTLRYAVLQYHNELKILRRNLVEAQLNLKNATGPLTEADHMVFQSRIDDLRESINTKQFQEERALEEMRSHNERDGRIRRFLKEIGDYFRHKENNLRCEGEVNAESHGWNTLTHHACINHQDDMTKVDLPHFVVNASSDITRWRFDANAHVNSVTNDTVIFSHEQGSGAKNASMIFEEILLQHLLTCRGEDIKIVVSDNASVGKNWITTIALPQYFVDQGLAKIVMVVFLENNHGKWLADMLFGQFQTRRKRSVILGIDDLLSEFERVKRKSGVIRGFSINPLSCIDFAEELRSLGYQTSPPNGFNFTKRNIHFSCACAAGAREGLSAELNSLIGDALPDNMGMVRISTEPPKNHLRDDRGNGSLADHAHEYFDVAAMQLSSKKRTRPVSEIEEPEVPLVVSLHQPFKEKGNLVVSCRNAQVVGHNGFGFRKSNACPELKDTTKPQIRRAWPRGLLDAIGHGEWSGTRTQVSDAVRCAPENWIVRRPVSFYCDNDSDWKARYPPRNLLNAKYRRGPRETDTWIPTATYNETPFPIIDGTCAKRAAENLASRLTNLGDSMHVLQIIQAVLEDMDPERDVSNPWGQNSVTVPCRVAIEKYKEEMRKYEAREEGCPTPAKSTRQFFKEDPLVVEKVAAETRRRGLTGTPAKRLETKLFGELFAEAEATPCGLDHYQRLMEKDVERYAREIKIFEVVQRRRDEEERRRSGPAPGVDGQPA